METSILDLGTLPGGIYSIANGVNSAGDVVVGQGTTNGAIATRAFVWRNGTMTQLTGLTGTSISSARGISGDGNVIVGITIIGGVFKAWSLRNNVYTALSTLGDPSGYGYAFDTNGDGSIVVGEGLRTDGLYRAVVWNSSGVTELGTLPSPYDESTAFATDLNGTYIVGRADGIAQPTQAFIWSAATGMVGLGFPTPITNMSIATAVSTNRIVVGIAAFSVTDTGSAFAYQNGVFTNLGRVSGFAFSRATDISADGSVITGYCYNTLNGSPFGTITSATAFRYTSGGMINIGDLGVYSPSTTLGVARDVGDNPSLTSLAYSVSADGLNVVGTSEVIMPSSALEQHAFLYRIRRKRIGYYDDNQKFTAQARDDQKKFSDASSYTQFLKARASGNMYRYQG